MKSIGRCSKGHWGLDYYPSSIFTVLPQWSLWQMRHKPEAVSNISTISSQYWWGIEAKFWKFPSEVFVTTKPLSWCTRNYPHEFTVRFFSVIFCRIQSKFYYNFFSYLQWFDFLEYYRGQDLDDRQHNAQLRHFISFSMRFCH